MKRAGLLATLVVTVLLGTLVLRSFREETSGRAGSPAQVGRPAPDVASQTLEGRPWRLQDQRGKVVLLDFWATWCGPCVQSLPAMKEFYESFKNHPDFVMAGVSLDDSPAAVRAFLKDDPLPWLQLHENTARGLAGAFDVNMLPTVILIDRAGTVVGVNLPHDELPKRVRELLQASG